MIRCSVVVPTYKRPGMLSRALAALTAQSLAPDEYEIIVCDDGKTDATRQVVERWQGAGPVSLTYLSGPTPGLGPAAMRNAGWRAARGDVIAFTDDDTIPDRDWLRQGLVALDDAVADAAGGRIVVPLPDEPTDYERDAARLEGAAFVTANCFCRRSVLQCVGGFDPRFRAAWREASDLFFKLIEKGFDVVQAIDAVVVYPVRRAPWGESMRAESKHVFDALLYKKHPDLYTQFIRPDRPHLYYAILATLAVAVIGLCVGSSGTVIAGITAWLCLTGALVARRLRATTRHPSHVAEIVVTSVAVPFLSIYHRIRGGILFRVAFW